MSNQQDNAFENKVELEESKGGQSSQEGSTLSVIRAPLKYLKIYDISEDELETLLQGSPGSTIFNFSVFFVSVGISFLISILTTTISSDRLFIIFNVVAYCSLAAGTVLFVIWYRQKSNLELVVQRIKNRMNP